MRSTLLARAALVMVLTTIGCSSAGHRAPKQDRNLITDLGERVTQRVTAARR